MGEGINLWWEVIKICRRRESTGDGIFPGGIGMSKFPAGGGPPPPPIPLVGKTLRPVLF